MKTLPLIPLLLILLFSGCNEVDPDGEKEVRAFVTKWNENHTQLKAAYLEKDYMDVVTYYGKQRTKQQVQQDKNLLFEQFPDYSQRVLDDQMTITKEAGTYLVTFTKRVTYNGIEADYLSYISGIHKNGAFKILREGVDENAKDRDAPIFPAYRQNSAEVTKNRRLYGDFNGDGLSDFATIVTPELDTVKNLENKDGDTVNCKGPCDSVITFSADLAPITVDGAYKATLENLKDLNADGADEIGFWDIKPTTKSLYVFNAKTGELLTEPIMINTTVHHQLDFIDVFKKTGPKQITVTQSVEENGQWKLQSKVVKLQ